jgi:hypothetical protein
LLQFTLREDLSWLGFGGQDTGDGFAIGLFFGADAIRRPNFSSPMGWSGTGRVN